MRNLTLIFSDFDKTLLGKDVLLVPVTIAKAYGLNCNILYIQTEKNQDLPKAYRGARLIGVKRAIKNQDHAFLNELALFRQLLLKAKRIDYLMLFFLTNKTLFYVFLYRLMNPRGHVYLKLDMNRQTSVDFLKPISTFRAWCNKALRVCLSGKIDLLSVETEEIYIKLKASKFFGNALAKKLIYLPNAFDEEALRVRDMRIMGIEGKKNRMITVGRLGSLPKNNEMLLKALERIDLKGWEVLFIGPCESTFRESYDTFIKRNPEKSDAVVLVGNVTDKAVLFEYYNNAKVFLLTSLWEGFALVYPEALRFGDYIITTDVGGARDITANGTIGKIVPINDVDALCRAISEVIEGKIDLEKKYEQSIALSKSHFLWEAIISSSEEFRSLFSPLS
jgi:GalNAc-alpha-(1->4)-GalNAc-alpha-(1->3)-diNAcBac-PP-undecaprenol alpha-1,4-N-acetyl-D-galactosaminyltransferase